MATKKTTSKPSKATARTYYPPKTFDDDLDKLTKLFTSKGWSFSGIDLPKLIGSVKTQRDERATHDALEIQYQSLHTSFGLAQEDRYQKFASALNAARGAFRTDKVIMAELDKFKRSFVRAKRTPPK